MATVAQNATAPATKLTAIKIKIEARSRALLVLSGGIIEGRRSDNMVLPEPGGPTNSRLCPPLAAISRATQKRWQI
jgi:hypothetical protein